MSIKPDVRNVGKRVRYTFRRGATSHTIEATILRFRGNTRGDCVAFAAWIRFDTQTHTVTCAPLKELEYV